MPIHISLGGENSHLYHPSVSDIEADDNTGTIYQRSSKFERTSNRNPQGTTTSGPHRDEAEFKLDGKNVICMFRKGRRLIVS